MDSRKARRPQQRKRIAFEEWQQLYGVKAGHASPQQGRASLFDEATIGREKPQPPKTMKTTTE